MSRRTFFAAAVLLTLFLAGVASYYASEHPDGLEYVASETGFGDTAEESATADSPLADYTTRGVDNGRLSGAVAGVAGVGLVALLGGALFWTLGRRPHAGTSAGGTLPEPDQADA
ncbi:PDGLE domain-containing protein [Nocardioides sp.]|uniref:PDGLE domain-containing protein n=1 Tax=Nocardioides sp. TaxID=35761 RepID=UPI002CD6E437|nr:PDGLE domain-containing protein [Nocardioides sp.]HXH80201.1 PDGLE domain-containing protein [Nocardioides sp.]